jgi:hypothetical protein
LIVASVSQSVRSRPQIYTPYSFAYGYFWSGRIEGRLTMGDREVHYDWAYARERM